MVNTFPSVPSPFWFLEETGFFYSILIRFTGIAGKPLQFFLRTMPIAISGMQMLDVAARCLCLL
jgi:hypothetical protein